VVLAGRPPVPNREQGGVPMNNNNLNNNINNVNVNNNNVNNNNVNNG
jgi:hypothetical protein